VVHAPPREPSDLTLVDDRLLFERSGRRFELISAPSGETTDSLLVWLPDEKTLFTGNLMGALYGALPNFYTLRGDRVRSVPRFIADLEKVIALAPELLVTGHDAPIVGKDRIAEDLTKLLVAVRHIHDETIAGMNAGKDLPTLMRDIALPANLRMRPGRGPVSWYVRAVWEEYSGWFMHRSTTELYAVPQSAIWADLVEAAGGPDALAARAAAHVAAGRPVEALHLTDIVLGGDAAHRSAREAQIGALTTLLERSDGHAFDEIGWLESEIAKAEAVLGGGAGRAP
jgi:alkyl sulfatase BDS1-like metallo-beta-lactamase superfamily hydrolase